MLSMGLRMSFCCRTSQTAAMQLRERLRESLALRAKPLQVLASSVPDDFASLFDAMLRREPAYADSGSPIWLDLSAVVGDVSVVDEARLGLLRRLVNERDRLSREVGRPLLVVLPADLRNSLAEMIPLQIEYLVLRISSEQDDTFRHATSQPTDGEPAETPLPVAWARGGSRRPGSALGRPLAGTSQFPAGRRVVDQ